MNDISDGGWAVVKHNFDPKLLILSKFYSVFFGFKVIVGHEEGTQKFKATAQNKAIYISFQMI